MSNDWKVVQMLDAWSFVSGIQEIGADRVLKEAADEIEKLRAALKTARRDALEEAALVIANKSVLETPASFEDILQRDVEMMSTIRALGGKE